MKTRKGIMWLAVILATALACVPAACSSDRSGYRINVPEDELSAYLGTYELPQYDVINDTGEICSEYKVKVKNVTDPDGENVEIEYGSIEAEKVGVYTVTYSASSSAKKASKVSDAAVRVRFSHEPPGIQIPAGELPTSYIQGATYNLPRITFTGSPDYTKTHIKLYHRSTADGEREEVEIVNSTFTAQFDSGEYVLVVHAESAVGAFRDREFVVPARPGPDTVVPGKVTYFDETFGLSQAKAGHGCTVEFSEETHREGENGSLKVEFNDFDANTSMIELGNLIERDISDYEFLTYYVYNPNEDFALLAGYAWFGDEECEYGKWTEVTVKTEDIVSGNTGCSSADITGLRVRLFPKTVAVIPDGVVAYISPIYAWNYAMMGKSSVMLQEGYETCETERYTPRDQDVESIVKTSGDEKIVWNENAGTFTIEAGLAPGRYEVVLTLTDSEENADTYTLTVDVIPAIGADGKIAHFDKEYGYMQVEPDKNVTLAYSMQHHYEDEEGSLELTFHGATGQLPMRFAHPSTTRVLDYDYIVYRVYNPNKYTIIASWAWFAPVEVEPDSWGEVKWHIADGFPNSGATANNISGLRFRIADPAGKDGEMKNGSKVYLSAVYVGKGIFEGNNKKNVFEGYEATSSDAFTAINVTVTHKSGYCRGA